MDRLKKIDQGLLGLALQFIKFGMVGVANTLITLVSYWVLVHIGLYYIISYAVGYLLGIANAYFWNNRYVFTHGREERSHVKSAAKVLISYGFTFLLSELLLYIQIDQLSWSHTVAPIINLFITIPLNFLLNKFWAFHN